MLRGRRRPARFEADIVLRVLVALGLGVDAYVHLHLATDYQAAAPGGIGEGTLFRIEAGIAAVTAAAVLVRAGRVISVLAFLVATTALAVVLVYRYVDIPAFGPFPSMYEPVWFTEKTLSAVAEAVAALAALLLVGRAWRGRLRAADARIGGTHSARRHS